MEKTGEDGKHDDKEKRNRSENKEINWNWAGGKNMRSRRGVMEVMERS